MAYLLSLAMFAIALFLILLVLVQRGRGGGLAGALGGMGGQSAFGTKAGDMFTKITAYTALVWIVICAIAVAYYRRGDDPTRGANFGNATQEQRAPGAGAAPAATPSTPRGAAESPAPEKSGETPAAPAAGTPAGQAPKGEVDSDAAFPPASTEKKE
jgi:preprotein translocase subunit SecG